MKYYDFMMEFKVNILPNLPGGNVVLDVARQNEASNLKIISNNIDCKVCHVTIV